MYQRKFKFPHEKLMSNLLKIVLWKILLKIVLLWKLFWGVFEITASLFWENGLKQCFKTRTGPVGRSETRPTQAWNRSGWRQKPAWELARWNPVDPAGQPGTRATRSNPAETRSIFFFILLDVKRRRFGLCFKGQNDEEQWSRIGHIDWPNLINKKINFNRCTEEQRRAKDVLIVVVSLRKRLVSCLKLLLFTNLLLSLSLFFIFGRVLNLIQRRAEGIILLFVDSVSLIQSQPSHLNLRYVSLFFLFCNVINPLLLGSVENGWGN